MFVWLTRVRSCNITEVFTVSYVQIIIWYRMNIKWDLSNAYLYRDHGTDRDARIWMSNLIDGFWAWEWGAWKRRGSHFMSNDDGTEWYLTTSGAHDSSSRGRRDLSLQDLRSHRVHTLLALGTPAIQILRLRQCTRVSGHFINL